MGKLDVDNPFNCGLRCTDIDPIYAVTAEDADQNSFTFLPELADLNTYAEAKLHDEYSSILSRAIQSGAIPLCRSTQKVPFPSAAQLTSCWIKRLEPVRCEAPDCQNVLYLDAIIVAEIDIFQPVCSMSATNRLMPYQNLLDSKVPLVKDHVRQWYRMSGVLDITGPKTNLIQSIRIYDRRDRRAGIPLSDSLIPVIAKADMEQEASRILSKYHFEEAVVNCGRLNEMELATRMELTVIPVRLSLDNHIRGALYLHRARVKVYGANGQKEYIEVAAGTILYDPVACGTKERVSETIIHECVHYDLHWLFYSLQRQYYDCVEFLACMDSRYEDGRPEDVYEQWLEDEERQGQLVQQRSKRTIRSEVDWAEWQARMLTLRIQMPSEQTRKKIKELLNLAMNYGNTQSLDAIAFTIPRLARYYGVSWKAAKIRMIELGYKEAEGVLNYVDGRYIPPYTTSCGDIKQGTSYVISEKDAERLYHTDPVFKKAVDSGRFSYVEGHYCYNDPKFIAKSGNYFYMTDNARKHMEQCCILFHIQYIRSSNAFDKDALHNDEWQGDPIAVALASIPLEALIGEAADKASAVADLPSAFGETLKHHRKTSGLTQEELAECLGVSRETITRYETAKKPRITKQMIARIGQQFKLRGEYTEDMMNKAGFILDTADEKDNVLRFVIYYLYLRDLSECDAYLERHHCLPLRGRKKEAIAV